MVNVKTFFSPMQDQCLMPNSNFLMMIQKPGIVVSIMPLKPKTIDFTL